MTTTTGMVGSIYYGKMKTVMAGGAVVEMHGNKGWKRTTKGGRGDGMTEK